MGAAAPLRPASRVVDRRPGRRPGGEPGVPRGGSTGAEWSRSGTHSGSGAYAVDDWLRIYANHSHERADQIRSVPAGG